MDKGQGQGGHTAHASPDRLLGDLETVRVVARAAGRRAIPAGAGEGRVWLLLLLLLLPGAGV